MPETNPTIKIYSNYSPNTNGEHILYDTFSDYTTFLATYLLDTVSVDNYRINAGTIKIDLSTSITLANYKNATYIIHDVDNMCYSVKSATYQSGYIIYDIEVDYWGTYIGSATFKNMHLLKGSPDLVMNHTLINDSTLQNEWYGNAWYDDYKIVGEPKRYSVIPPSDYRVFEDAGFDHVELLSFIKLEKVYIVFVLQYVVESVNFGSGAITNNALFAFDLETLKNRFFGAVGTASQDRQAAAYNCNIIDVACGIVGGIYSTEIPSYYISNLKVEGDACVTKVFLATENMLNLATPVSSPKIHSKSIYGTYTDLIAKTVIYGRKKINEAITVPPQQYTIPSEFFTYYVGTPTNGIKYNMTKENTPYWIETLATVDGLQVIVENGENQKDITEAFSLPFSTNSGDVTQLGFIKHALGFVTNGLMSLANAYAGNVGGAVANATNAVKSIAPDAPQSKGVVNAGDGMITFRGEKPFDPPAGHPYAYEYSVVYPFGYTRYQSYNNEKLLHNQFGVNYDAYIEDVKTVFPDGDNAYLIMANVDVDNIPTVAQNEIIGKFVGGVRIRYISYESV